MSLDFNPVDLEKIRYQIGVIIKSWPRVNRIITDDFVAYSITKSTPETVFAILFDDTLLLCPHGQLSLEKITIDTDRITASSQFNDLNLAGELISISLQQYQFTEVIPTIEQVYRALILNHSNL